MNIFENRTLGILEKALEGANLKQKAIAHNIANINTPGFKSLEVNFQKQLKRAIESERISLKTTSRKHISNKQTINEITPEVSRNSTTSMRPDGNNVDIDKEMTEMAVNNIYYHAAVEQLNRRLMLLKHVISEGRK